MWEAYGIGLSAFFFVVAAGSFSDQRRKRNRDPDEWLFTRGFEKIYDAIFGTKDPAHVVGKLGLPYDKYLTNCRVIRHTPNLKEAAGMRLTGVTLLGIALVLTVLLQAVWAAFIGIGLYLCLGPLQTRRTEQQAAKRRHQLAEDLPRYIDLFKTALEVGMPVESAIKMTAQEIPCVVSEELLLATAETELGAKSWQQALEQVALRYQVDVFSDFVLNLTTAYEKGVPIAQIVAQKSSDIKQMNLLSAKERSAKLSNTILVPVMIFKILPLLAIMLIPIVMQISNM